MQPLHLTIEGMACEHCVRAVDGRLRRTPGVEAERVAIGLGGGALRSCQNQL